MPRVTLSDFAFMSELERYDTFMRLYNSMEQGDRESLAELYATDDPLIPLIILQYLEELPEKKAVLPILRLIERGNEVVSRAAMDAYKRNHYPGKARHLKQLVLSKDSRACRFAVRTLSRAGFMDILPLIIRELPEREEGVRLEMIEGLRYLPDRRSAAILVPLTASPDEEVRHRAVSVLADLQVRTRALDVGFFVRLTRDDSERVRRAALEALRMFPSRRVAQLLLDQALDEKEPESARDRAIRALASFPSPGWVRPLTLLASDSATPGLKLACEVALRSFPPKVLRAGLLPLLEDPEPDTRRQAATFLADFLGEDPVVRGAILRLWHKADDMGAVDLVEVLRLLEGADAAGLLRDAVKRSPLVAYSAAGALARMRGAGAGPALISLVRDGGLSPTVRQALFAHWAKRGPDEAIKDDLLPFLLEALSSEVINIRYLALQILGWYPLAGKIRALLDVLYKEPDPEVVNTISKQISLGLGRDPIPLAKALVAHPERASLLGHAVRLLTHQSWDVSRVEPLLNLLRADPLLLLERHPETYIAVCVHLLAYGALTFQDLWERLETAERRRLLVRLLNSSMRSMKRRFPPLPLEFLRARLAEEPAETRPLFYELMAAEQTPAAAESLAAALLREDHEGALALGAARLRELLTGAAG
ncbi:MAG: HEAT repeat domain-containing protein [Elusimicrobia bacterium]|nr:HEAT repeat domain-containing protein [Elusimicrobiota bacterium]